MLERFDIVAVEVYSLKRPRHGATRCRLSDNGASAEVPSMRATAFTTLFEIKRLADAGGTAPLFHAENRLGVLVCRGLIDLSLVDMVSRTACYGCADIERRSRSGLMLREPLRQIRSVS
jgi:hypothetical protein